MINKKDEKYLVNKNIDIMRDLIMWACDNGNKTSVTYSNFLTTIAGVALGLSPLIFSDKDVLTISIWIKIVFIVSLVLILLSLFFGAVNTLLEKKFYEKWSDNYTKIFNKWNSVSVGEITIEEAQCFQDCISSSYQNKPKIWPIILQSLFLFIGFSGILVVISMSIL